MSDMNQVFLIGRLTRDAELKYTANGKAVSKFSLAVNEKRKDGDRWKDEAGFFDLTVWGQLAESLNQYLVKGKQIAVTGKLQQERWEQDGYNRSRVTVTVAAIQLLGGTSGIDGGAAQNHGDSIPDSVVERKFEAAKNSNISGLKRDMNNAADAFADDIPF